MYADVDARAGVLKPEGWWKSRCVETRSLMERLNSIYASLKQECINAAKTVEERAQASELLAAREVYLQPTYKQIALLCGDLHE